MSETKQSLTKPTETRADEEARLRTPRRVARSATSIWSQWILIIVIVAVAVFIGYSKGTLRVPSAPVMPAQTGNPPASNERLDKLELQYALLKDSLERSIKQYENLLTYFAVVVSLMVGFQAYLAQRQSSREQERHEAQATIEDQGVERVAKILDVVHKTLHLRFTTEEELKTYRENSDHINQFLKTQQSIIRKRREAIEKTAAELAAVRRQNLRAAVRDLEAFAQHYDTFEQQYADLEETVEGKRGVSARAEYIRGIAAHFASQPTAAAKYLRRVTACETREEDEDTDLPYRKRKASAYYYIGLNLANISDPAAVDQFESAITTYPNKTDYLTRIVLAEAYATQLRFFEMERTLGPEITDWETHKNREADEVELGLFKKAVLAPTDVVYRRLRSRVTVIRVNAQLQQRGTAALEECHRMLSAVWGAADDDERDPLSRRDRGYYYAISTLGQVVNKLRGAKAAEEYFDHAHDKIIDSDDLHTVAEIRSRILLRLVAALCSLHGSRSQQKAMTYLTEATNQLDLLPALNGKRCTVFSPLSRTNEPPETIGTHIQAIRDGEVFRLSVGAPT